MQQLLKTTPNGMGAVTVWKGCCLTSGMGAVTEWNAKAFYTQLQAVWVLSRFGKGCRDTSGMGAVTG
jgi:hypothetical protein